MPLLLLIVAAMTSPHPSAAEDRPVWVGTGSCAALACHGGRREPLGLKGSEYGFTEAYDPHGRAFSALYDDRSKVIQKNLQHLADVEQARPFENDLCLRCHVHQGYDSRVPQARSATFAQEDGVGCEGCHGAAGKWIVPHTESWWKGLTEAQKERDFGLSPTKDLLARGRNCAGCHVGTASADVNHDLIAAGHPRLNFEYGGQLAKLPKHWRVGDDKARNRDYEAKVWALGQVVAAQASLGLLESRARRAIADAKAPWPELAEYSCFACHHELSEPSPRRAGPSLAGKPGALPWGTWYLPMVGAVGLSGLETEAPGSPLGDLRKSMARPSPDASLVARRARAASDELGRMAEAIRRDRIEPADARSMLARALGAGVDGRPLDWDRAAQQYLAIVALDRSLADYDPRYLDLPVRMGLERMLRNLNLPRQVGGRDGTFDSPYRYDPARIGDDLRALRAALPQP